MVKRSDKNTARRILCLDCRHFKITWEPKHPRACSAMGFKSKQWPCFEVMATSGEACMKFSAKPDSKDNRGKLDKDQERFSLKA